jgi:hypothetical protein
LNSHLADERRRVQGYGAQIRGRACLRRAAARELAYLWQQPQGRAAPSRPRRLRADESERQADQYKQQETWSATQVSSRASLPSRFTPCGVAIGLCAVGKQKGKQKCLRK